MFEYAFVSQCHCDVLSILKVIKDYFSPYDYVQEGGWMPTMFVIRLPFTIFTYTIMHLVYPPTFCTTIVFACSQDNRNTLEKLEMMAMQFFFFCMGGGRGGGG